MNEYVIVNRGNKCTNLILRGIRGYTVPFPFLVSNQLLPFDAIDTLFLTNNNNSSSKRRRRKRKKERKKERERKRETYKNSFGAYVSLRNAMDIVKRHSESNVECPISWMTFT
ncbi:hypothetical protein HZH66_008403 [Vespula vulgaris]|uniref:Uncharacterized protein n=1 Tax=Vespula vulgaris TaxID=7454 RepID=A0A834N1Q0_VESVU|nr:hypothetical protein HZH66_008403 [Vespula vulgaris]